jgi:hypothetical protein
MRAASPEWNVDRSGTFRENGAEAPPLQREER